MAAGHSIRMLVGLVVGAGLGIAAHLVLGDSPLLAGAVEYVTDPLGQIFLRLLFMLVVPLIVSALALGVAGLGDLRSLGRVGLRTLLCTALFSAIAVAIGVTLVNGIRPGEGLDAAARAALGPLEVAPALTQAPSGMDFLVGMVPQNPLRAMADGDYLAVMVFALFLGIGIAGARSAAVARFGEALQGLYEVTMRLLGIVIAAAPVGVACLMFTLTARLGYDVIGLLASYVAVVLLGLALQQLVVYALAVQWLGGLRPRAFFRGVRAAMVTAFSTSSSNATLPTSLAVAEEELRLPPQISRFVLTMGSTANQNGTALFEGVTVLFLAQFFGVELSLAEQLKVVGICVLGGIGTAGVPAGSLPVIAMILGLIGVPPEGIGMILGVDRLLDMCRTVVNVTGDLAVAVVVSGTARGAPGQAA